MTIYGTSGKLCHILSTTLTIQWPYLALQGNFVACCPWHWRSNDHIWHFRKTLSHSFLNTDDPKTIFGTSGKLCRMLFVILTIQQPYMVDLGYCRKLLRHTKTCKVLCSFLSFKLVKWRSNETLASVGLTQACTNYLRNVCGRWSSAQHSFLFPPSSLPSGLSIDHTSLKNMVSVRWGSGLSTSCRRAIFPHELHILYHGGQILHKDILNSYS